MDASPKTPLLPDEGPQLFSEMKRQLLLAGPLVIVNLMICSLQVISIMFVGHLGELSLAGASMATSFASVTGISLLVRQCSSLDFVEQHLLQQSKLGNVNAD